MPSATEAAAQGISHFGANGLRAVFLLRIQRPAVDGSQIMASEFKRRVTGRGVPGHELRVSNKDTGEEIGVLGDISMSGARVRAAIELAPGSTMVVDIALPQEVGALRSLTLQARCQWCKPAERGDQWELGLEFTESLSHEESQALGALIHIWSV